MSEQTYIQLYRGHKQESYLETKYEGICFSEAKQLANLYGLGNNDTSDLSVKDGYVTTVEFHGIIKDIPVNGLDLVKKPIPSTFKAHPAVRCKDGVVIVFDSSRLKNPTRESAKGTDG